MDMGSPVGAAETTRFSAAPPELLKCGLECSARLRVGLVCAAAPRLPVLAIVLLPEDIAARGVQTTIQLQAFLSSNDSIPFRARFGCTHAGFVDTKPPSFGASQFATPNALLNPFALAMFAFIYNGLTVGSG
jgi:hypothetical protein